MASAMTRVQFKGGDRALIDFTGIQAKGGGRAARVKPGDYGLKVVECKIQDTNDKSSKFVNWTISIIAGEARGTIYHRTGLTDNSLWSTRLMLEAVGKEVPDKAAVDFGSLAGLTFGATIGDGEPYQSKDREGNLEYDETTGDPKMRTNSEIIVPYTWAEWEKVAATQVGSPAPAAQAEQEVEQPAAAAPKAPPKPAAKPKTNGAAAAPVPAAAEPEVAATEDADLEEIDFKAL